MNRSTLILFKSAVIEKHIKKFDTKHVKNVNSLTIPHGYIISPEIISSYEDFQLGNLKKAIEQEIIIKDSQINNAFHKSWDKIAKASDVQLYIEQIIHYMTTYGLESLGCEYDADNVFIPYEKLKIPALKENISLIYIKALTKKEVKEKTMAMMMSGIALKEETMDLIYDILNEYKLTEQEISLIKNKEMKITLYQKYDIVPKNPIEFLRFLIYEATGKTLIIKNKFTFELIRTNLMEDKTKQRRILNYFEKYKDANGLELLSGIFYRFKMLFIAFKGIPKMNSYINRLRKLAVANHKPMEEDYLNTVTGKIKNCVRIDFDILRAKLSESNIFRKLRLLYALNYRRNPDHTSVVYKIRNLKAFSTKIKPCDFDVHSVFTIIKQSIIQDLKKNVNKKKIYIPDGISYSLPATEKQFTGNFPSGTRISTNKNIIVGIHWEDQKGERIDLDLSLLDLKGNKYGWDAYARNNERSILFSGDNTAAPLPNGASELFYIKKFELGIYLLSVNYFNYDEKIPVPLKIVVGYDNRINDSFNKTYILDPNKIIAVANSVINKPQKILGSLTISMEGCEFVFSEMDMGKSRSVRANEYIQDTLAYFYDFYKDSISMKELLIEAGASVISNKDDLKKDEKFIDLSVESMSKETILSLLKR